MGPFRRNSEWVILDEASSPVLGLPDEQAREDPMNCGPLGVTGLDGLAMLVAAVLAACLIIGGVILVRTRRRPLGVGAGTAMALMLVAALSLGTLGASPAVAADCPPSTPSPSPTDALRIDQTSTIFGMRPGVAPAPIEGTITNRTGEELFVTDVVVSISGVTLSPDAAPGTCTADDYVLLDSTMPVNQMVPPFGSVNFSGASIGFVDQPWNQDACKGATVHLAYVTT